jgi:GNAT superfamily N-acetyltransferase
VLQAPVDQGCSEWCARVATPGDDAAIRRLLAANPVPGRITLAFEREPSYALGCRTHGPFWQVVVARQAGSGQIGALLCRAARSRYVNGEARDVGYFGQLRVDAAHRGRWLTTHLLHAVEQVHADGRVSGYLATISDGNPRAHDLLVRLARSRFPTFRPVGRLWTLALHLPLRPAGRPAGWPAGRRAPGGPPAMSADEISRAGAGDVGEIVAFLRRHGREKQFFPAYAEADFSAGGTTPGFAVEDFVVARRRGDIAGVVGLWDQTGAKQTVVRGYNGALRWLRPAYNAAARLMGARSAPLPAPGAHLRAAHAAFVCVAGNDPRRFGTLLRSTAALAARRGVAYLLVGLAEGDPLLDVARAFAHVPYGSTLYTVCLPGDEAFHTLPDRRLPYAEVATL